MAWSYGVVSTIIWTVTLLVLLRRSPDLVKERAGSLRRKDAKRWDKLVLLVALAAYLAVLVVAGLDRRFGWAGGFQTGIEVAGAVFFALGLCLTAWAMLINRFFSAVVRIQTDRGQTVVTRGPYRVVRHPGYAGAIIAQIAACFMLGSVWSIVPVTAYAAAFTLRTALEDNMLVRELPGYRQYAARTRYRLLPGIW
jgi:protein-S-isoprenylcysteine O-methyltransferase Ste14